jgi:hypothetical protein
MTDDVQMIIKWKCVVFVCVVMTVHEAKSQTSVYEFTLKLNVPHQAGALTICATEKRLMHGGDMTHVTVAVQTDSAKSVLYFAPDERKQTWRGYDIIYQSSWRGEAKFRVVIK